MSPRVLPLGVVCAATLHAHAGEPLGPDDLLTDWQFDPGVCVPLLLVGLLYVAGSRRGRIAWGWQAGCFCAGFGLLAIALISPLHPLGEVLFAAHMMQHEILMLLAAPLLVLSRPLVPLLWGLPLEARRIVGRWSKAEPAAWLWQTLTNPVVAWAVHGATIWGWHAPFAFEATLQSDWVHAAQHVSFFGTALLFWWSLFRVRGEGYGSGVLSLFTTAVHTSILGALLTFSTTLWYPAYSRTASAWGYAPLEDQQVGGLIMWVPGGLVYLAAALVLFAKWMRASGCVRRYAE